MNDAATHVRRTARLATPTSLGTEARRDLSGALNALLADCFALYLKTKNFHWHMSGPHFRDYHLMLDEQAAQIFAATDDMAERVRKIGGTTLRRSATSAAAARPGQRRGLCHPAGHAGRAAGRQQAAGGDMRETHGVCDEHGDVASASLLENWIDEAERRTWFLFEASRSAETAGR